jgi:hypothetical protein
MLAANVSNSCQHTSGREPMFTAKDAKACPELLNTLSLSKERKEKKKILACFAPFAVNLQFRLRSPK